MQVKSVGGGVIAWRVGAERWSCSIGEERHYEMTGLRTLVS